MNFGHSVKDLKIPEDSAVILIARDEKLIYDFEGVRLREGDIVLVYAAPASIRKMENIFYL